jgi:hypothetical protein
MKRKNETNDKNRYRSSRMFENHGNWFFNTREGDAVGPFQDKLAAATQLEVYIRLVESGLLPTGEKYAVHSMAVSS